MPGSCPAANPPYPSPDQALPPFGVAGDTASVAPGATAALNFTDAANQPVFAKGEQYRAVFFHGVTNISVPVEVSRWPGEAITITVPRQFEERGVIIAVIANETGAPDLDAVIAGPQISLQQNEQVGVAMSS